MSIEKDKFEVKLAGAPTDGVAGPRRTLEESDQNKWTLKLFLFSFKCFRNCGDAKEEEEQTGAGAATAAGIPPPYPTLPPLNRNLNGSDSANPPSSSSIGRMVAAPAASQVLQNRR